MQLQGYLILIGVLVIVGLGLMWIGSFFPKRTDPWGDNNNGTLGVFIAGLIAAGVALVVSVVVTANYIDAHFNHLGCQRYGNETEREVRWVRPSVTSYYCLVETDEGWVRNDSNVKVDD